MDYARVFFLTIPDFNDTTMTTRSALVSVNETFRILFFTLSVVAVKDQVHRGL